MKQTPAGPHKGVGLGGRVRIHHSALVPAREEGAKP